MSQLSEIEQSILNTVRNNKPMSISQLREKLYSNGPPGPEFYHDLNYLIMYREALKVKKGKVLEHYKILKPLKEDFITILCSECPIHLITKEKDDAVA